MANGTCSIDGCDRPAKSRGWCASHYNRWLRLGDPGAAGFNPVTRRAPDRFCSVDGCDRLAEHRGWCNAHYIRWRIHGDPTAGGKPHDGSSTPCNVDGCDGPSVAWGWCEAHYRRWKKSGDVGSPDVRQVGSGDDVGYNTAHRRVAEAKGAASQHDCINCGGHAREWAYDHADPDARIASPGNPRIAGMPYSLSVDHYQPMCKSCHKAFDKAHARAD